ncbi:hypothetical protein [Rhabdothermincola sp.]|uniref:hypothetical protein n=1 Tax=Rhabdothermincola sp. TaxID=2820405 RepID=UPI002FDF61A5
MARGVRRRGPALALTRVSTLAGVPLALVALVVSTAGAPAGAVTAQTGSSFPSPRFAPVQAPSAPGATALVAVGNDDGRPVLRFAPDAPAELSATAEVVIGVPGGETVTVRPGSMPRALPAGSGLWVMAGTTQLSAVFDASALLGPDAGAERSLPGNRWGAVQRDGVPLLGAVDTGVTAPALSMDNRALVLTASDRPPASIDGEPVVAVDDFVRLVPSEQAASGGTDFIRVDRTAGRIQLLETGSGTLADVTGDGTWITEGLRPEDPTAAGVVAFDLEASARAVGLAAGADQLAVSVDRRYTLADGRVVTVYGVAATVGWLTGAGEARAATTVALPARDEPAMPAQAASTGGGSGALVGGAVAAALALVAVAIVLVVRTRRPGSARSSPEQALAALDAQIGELRRNRSGPPAPR